MILLVCKESSTQFQIRFKRYLDARGLASQLIFLQPFDLLLKNNNNINIFGYEDIKKLVKAADLIKTDELHQTLENYLTREDLSHIKNTQWLNMDLGRSMFKDVSEDDCYKYLYILITNFERIFDQYQPSTVFDTDVDNYARRILYKMCIKKGVFYQTLVHSRFEDFILVTDSMDDPRTLTKAQTATLGVSTKVGHTIQNFKNKSILSSTDDIQLTKSIQRFKKRYILKLIGQVKFTIQTLVRKKLMFGKCRFSDIVFPSFSGVWAYNLSVLYHTVRRKIISRSPTKGSKYVYLPLSYTNEGVDSFCLGEFANELDFIQILKRECMERGLKLFVRDHPHMIFERKIRDEMYMNSTSDFYENSVAACQTNSIEYVKNATYVVTLNGTTSLEAKMFGIPTFTFGKPLHEYLFDAQPIGAVQSPLKTASKLSNFFNLNRLDVIKIQQDKIFKYINYVERFGYRYSFSSVLRGDLAENEKDFFKFILDKLQYDQNSLH